MRKGLCLVSAIAMALVASVIWVPSLNGQQPVYCLAWFCAVALAVLCVWCYGKFP